MQRLYSPEFVQVRAQFDTAHREFEDTHDSEVFDDPNNEAIGQRFTMSVEDLILEPAETLDDLAAKLEVIDELQIDPDSADGYPRHGQFRGALACDIDRLGTAAEKLIGRMFQFENWLSSEEG